MYSACTRKDDDDDDRRFLAALPVVPKPMVLVVSREAASGLEERMVDRSSRSGKQQGEDDEGDRGAGLGDRWRTKPRRSVIVLTIFLIHNGTLLLLLLLVLLYCKEYHCVYAESEVSEY